MPNTNENTTASFNELVMAEIDNNAVKVLKTHPRDILDRTLYFVDRVFVAKDSDEDSVATKMDAAATMLENLASAIRSEDNPLSISYPMNDQGEYIGSPISKVSTEFAKVLLPEAVIERSRTNRVKAAAKKMAK